MKDYIATEADLNTIKEALSFVWNAKLDFIFQNKKLIVSTVVISYDSKHLYLWIPSKSKPGQYRLKKIPHSLIAVPAEYHRGWCAGVWDKIEEFLPNSIKNASRFAIPCISGGLLGPFISSQKTKKLPLNPYTTYESYLATVVHEFGHIYWNHFQLWWYSDKKENVNLLKEAIKLYLSKEPNLSKYSPYVPLTGGLGETFAFCTEYCASNLFWSIHKKLMDKFIVSRLKKLLAYERTKNRYQQGSSIEPATQTHDFSFVAGKIVMSHHPTNWPTFLTSKVPIIKINEEVRVGAGARVEV